MTLDSVLRGPPIARQPAEPKRRSADLCGHSRQGARTKRRAIHLAHRRRRRLVTLRQRYDSAVERRRADGDRAGFLCRGAGRCDL